MSKRTAEFQLTDRNVQEHLNSRDSVKKFITFSYFFFSNIFF